MGAPHVRGKRFTLVELMIVVAIILILASVATANYQSMQYRAKRAEVAPLLHGIAVAMIAYESAFDSWPLGTGWEPDNTPTKTMRVWPDPSGFDLISWRPSSAVRGSYRLSTSTANFLAEAVCDVDGDGVVSTWTADKQINVTMLSGAMIY